MYSHDGDCGTLIVVIIRNHVFLEDLSISIILAITYTITSSIHRMRGHRQILCKYIACRLR
jgi:hypothetical protein